MGFAVVDRVPGRPADDAIDIYNTQDITNHGEMPPVTGR